ncbi:hypothetical protein RvY_01552-3 [Ramazzottius varieornatus]|uniref:Uncharacterized protein n=1 Tax=Ramazzottius varieornatus TaxID=947166 RepID=A0A1D1UKK9_RAMVA|nr:hypothetical protein RvY_01552-3 [Ramazzottius varieornatus]
MRLLNTSMDTDGKFTCSGRNLALKATNRTFSLRTGVSFIDENGVRQLDTAVYRFSLTTNSMQVVGFFDLSSRLLLWDSNVTADWPNGIIPVDMPPCGFAGLSEACIPTNHSWVDDLKVAFPIVASFAVLLLMTSVWYQHNHSRSKHETESWILDPALLRSYQTETSSVKTTVNVTVSLIGLLKKEFNFG